MKNDKLNEKAILNEEELNQVNGGKAVSPDLTERIRPKKDSHKIISNGPSADSPVTPLSPRDLI